MIEPHSAEEIATLANRALSSLPSAIRDRCEDVVISVEDFATQDQLVAVGLTDRWTLSGLYEGSPLPDRSIWEASRMPPRVWLFRMPILAEMRERRISLAELVHHVTVHEIGHHFGFSDEEMHALEAQVDRS